MLTTKNKKETAKELTHTDVFINNSYIGYVIKNNSPFANVGENWNFVSKDTNYPMMYCKTKKGLLNKITLTNN